VGANVGAAIDHQNGLAFAGKRAGDVFGVLLAWIMSQLAAAVFPDNSIIGGEGHDVAA
jgi:hypothetical protein